MRLPCLHTSNDHFLTISNHIEKGVYKENFPLEKSNNQRIACMTNNKATIVVIERMAKWSNMDEVAPSNE
jgi:hypothetical protein